MAASKPPAKRKRKPRLLPLLVDVQTQLAVISRWAEEDREQLELLAHQMGVADGPSWYGLALALARKHEPWFKNVAQPGKWNDLVRGMLVVEIERLTGDKRLTGKRPENPLHTATWAAGILAQRPEWQDFLHGGVNPAEALRVKYSKMHRDKLAPMFRKAFKQDRLQDTIAEWDKQLRDALKRH